MLTIATLLISAVIQGSPCGAAPAAPTADQLNSANSAAQFVAMSKLSDGTAVPAAAVLPAMANTPAVMKYMREHYPEDMRMDSVQRAPAVFWMCVDTAGIASNVKMIGTAGAPTLDSLAAQLITMARFSSATVDGKKVAVWLPYPLQLSPMGIVGDAKPTSKELSKQPVYTPYDVAPQLMNGQQVAIEMMGGYPPSLKSSGVSGLVVMWLFVDEKGGVKNATIKQSSGQKQLDDFATGLASMMRFSPATKGGVKVPVWIALPLRMRPS